MATTTTGTVSGTNQSMQSYPSVYSPYGGTNLAYDTGSDLYLPDTNLDEVRTQMESLYSSIGTAYEDLINSGRTANAYNLKEAADRLSATGSELGVNSWARQQAITDLSNEMAAAQSYTENQYLVQMLGQQQSVLQSLADLDNNSFNQAMKVYNAAAQQQAQQQDYLSQYKAATAGPETPKTPWDTSVGGDKTVDLTTDEGSSKTTTPVSTSDFFESFPQGTTTTPDFDLDVGGLSLGTTGGATSDYLSDYTYGTSDDYDNPLAGTSGASTYSDWLAHEKEEGRMGGTKSSSTTSTTKTAKK